MLDSASVVLIVTTKVVLLVGCTVVKTTCLIKVVLNDKEMSAALIPRTFARASLMASKLDSVTAGVKIISLVIVTGPAKHKLFHRLFFNINYNQTFNASQTAAVSGLILFLMLNTAFVLAYLVPSPASSAKSTAYEDSEYYEDDEYYYDEEYYDEAYYYEEGDHYEEYCHGDDKECEEVYFEYLDDYEEEYLDELIEAMDE